MAFLIVKNIMNKITKFVSVLVLVFFGFFQNASATLVYQGTWDSTARPQYCGPDFWCTSGIASLSTPQPTAGSVSGKLSSVSLFLQREEEDAFRTWNCFNLANCMYGDIGYVEAVGYPNDQNNCTS